MRIEDRLRTSAQRVADEVDPPAVDIDGIRKGAQAGQRRRIAIVATVLATILVGVVAPRLVNSFSSAPIPPIPADRPTQPTRPVHSTPVWADDDGIHLGDTVMKVPFKAQKKCPQEADGMCPLFTSLALVAGGVVYGDASTYRVWYQPWTGSARVIGSGSRVGPAGDPDGTSVAWFDEHEAALESRGGLPSKWDLVMFDTATATETARVSQDADVITSELNLSRWAEWHFRAPGSQTEHEHGNKINDVTPDTVTWNGVWTFDRLTGRPSLLHDPALEVPNHDPAPEVFDVASGRTAIGSESGEARVTSPEGDVTWRSKRGQFERGVLQFSADGRYLAGVTNGDGQHHPVVADTRTSDVFIPYRGDIYPWIGWGYDDTLMVYQDHDGDHHDRNQLLACDVSERSCQRLSYKGAVTLPNGG